MVRYVGRKGSRRSEKVSLILAERPANGGLLQISGQSLDCHIGHSQREKADSLRRTFGIFPFLRDCTRRPGSIWHCVAGLAVWINVVADHPRMKSSSFRTDDGIVRQRALTSHGDI
jgi:hypothetical protein